jgi:hypothetical protein
MLRSTLIVAAAGLLCGISTAQRQLTSGDIHTIPPGAIQQGGTFDWSNKTWVGQDRAAVLRNNSLSVYDNTCTWTGGGFYGGFSECEDMITDGRIPGGVGGNNPLGSTTDNLINSFQFGYCTTAITGAVDIKIGFYDTLGGTCLGGVAAVPPSLSSQANAYFDFGAAAGFPLPGSAASGTLACWIIDITNFGFCLQSDGDGFFDNVGALDNFNWSYEGETPIAGTTPSGLILSGEPSTSPVSGCTYNIPCGTDFFSNTPCGHGLGQDDAFWINVDNDLPGNTSNTGAQCNGAAPAGSNCYWYGGYPANPYAGFWMKMGSAGECAGCDGDPVNYCTAGTTTNGCNANMSLASGVPSIKANAGPCIVTASNVEGNKQGLIFFGVATAAAPWGTGSSSFLCVKSPTQRAPAQNSGGTANTCQGAISADLNALISSGSLVGNQLFVGSKVYAQGWFRDPAAPKTTNLSNGLELSICP